MCSLFQSILQYCSHVQGSNFLSMAEEANLRIKLNLHFVAFSDKIQLSRSISCLIDHVINFAALKKKFLIIRKRVSDLSTHII